MFIFLDRCFGGSFVRSIGKIFVWPKKKGMWESKTYLTSMILYRPNGVDISFSMTRAYRGRILNLTIIRSSSSLTLGNFMEDAESFRKRWSKYCRCFRIASNIKLGMTIKSYFGKIHGYWMPS